MHTATQEVVGATGTENGAEWPGADDPFAATVMATAAGTPEEPEEKMVDTQRPGPGPFALPPPGVHHNPMRGPAPPSPPRPASNPPPASGSQPSTAPQDETPVVAAAAVAVLKSAEPTMPMAAVPAPPATHPAAVVAVSEGQTGDSQEEQAQEEAKEEEKEKEEQEEEEEEEEEEDTKTHDESDVQPQGLPGSITILVSNVHVTPAVTPTAEQARMTEMLQEMDRKNPPPPPPPPPPAPVVVPKPGWFRRYGLRLLGALITLAILVGMAWLIYASTKKADPVAVPPEKPLATTPNVIRSQYQLHDDERWVMIDISNTEGKPRRAEQCIAVPRRTPEKDTALNERWINCDPEPGTKTIRKEVIEHELTKQPVLHFLMCGENCTRVSK
jgi:hypothetical protein